MKLDNRQGACDFTLQNHKSQIIVLLSDSSLPPVLVVTLSKPVTQTSFLTGLCLDWFMLGLDHFGFIVSQATVGFFVASHYNIL